MTGQAEPENEQRRSHVRVDLNKTCSVRMAGKPKQVAELIDLSGTGCGFLISAAMQEGARGMISIDFPGWTLKAPIQAIYVRQRSEAARTYVGASFDGLTTSETERVVREVFSEMRRQLQKVRRGT